MHKATIFLSIVLLLAMAAMGAYIWQNEQDKKALMAQLNAVPEPQPLEVPSILSNTEEDLTATETATPSDSGTITGSLSFPSEQIPELEVCAENLATHQEICTTDMLKEAQYTYGVGYKLDVPAGSYYVYAKLPNDSYKAYYNEFVECGLSVECKSHTPIEVTVTTDEVTTGIDPQDWYNRENQ